MRHSLQSHVIYLEDSIQSLRDLLTAHSLDADELQQIERQLAYAELALERYREAYALELNVSNPQPPDRPGTESGGDTEGIGDRDKSNPEKKNRLATVAGRTRKRFVRVVPTWDSFSLEDYLNLRLWQIGTQHLFGIFSDLSDLRCTRGWSVQWGRGR